MDSHSSRAHIAVRFKQPTRVQRGPRLQGPFCNEPIRTPIWSCSEWGLPCRSCYHLRGALLPHPFTLTSRRKRSTLCCTGRRFTPPRRYLAPCPMEPGLSSPIKMNDSGDCPADFGVSVVAKSAPLNSPDVIWHPLHSGPMEP